jgi:poly-gamma-glutamate synthesis protein (capsule biosynthesis protein)
VISVLALGAGSAGADPRSLRILFVGDVMLDGGPGHRVTVGGDPFAEVASVLRDSDLTIGNLECAIVRDGQAVGKPYGFRGPERALPLLKRYFSAVSVANNHSSDWGKTGFMSELQLLRAAKLPWFGGGANLQEAHSPLVLVSQGFRIALLGYSDFPPKSMAATTSGPGIAWLSQRDVARDIRTARVEGRADRVLLFLHWGEELEQMPTQAQQRLARQLIDDGADAIIGSHPHVTQTIEWYRGRPVVYSLGNFVFDYFPYDPPVWTGWMVRLTFGENGSPGLEKIPVELDAAGIPHLKEPYRPSRDTGRHVKG